MKRYLLLSLFLVTGLVFHGLWFVQPAQANFPDVPVGHNNKEAIDWLFSQGHVNGNPDGTFAPDANITRAAFLKIITHASGNVASEEDLYSDFGDGRELIYSNCFPDVKEEWFAGYICKAEYFGLINGYEDGTFKPGQNISLAEASKIMLEFFRYSEPALEHYADFFEGLVAPQDPWFEAYVNTLASSGAIPPTFQEFSDLVTRGEMSEMVYRIVTRQFDKPSLAYSDISNAPLSGDLLVLKDECGIAHALGALSHTDSSQGSIFGSESSTVNSIDLDSAFHAVFGRVYQCDKEGFLGSYANWPNGVFVEEEMVWKEGVVSITLKDWKVVSVPDDDSYSVEGVSCTVDYLSELPYSELITSESYEYRECQ